MGASVLASIGRWRLRVAAAGDCATILSWRNRDRVRLRSFTTTEIDIETHRAWFSSALSRRDMLMAIFEVGVVPAGYVGATFARDDSATWSFYIGDRGAAPPGSGRGMLRAFLAILAERRVPVVLAETLPGNDRSAMIHERLGFHRVDPNPERAQPHQRWRLEL